MVTSTAKLQQCGDAGMGCIRKSLWLLSSCLLPCCCCLSLASKTTPQNCHAHAQTNQACSHTQTHSNGQSDVFLDHYHREPEHSPGTSHRCRHFPEALSSWAGLTRNMKAGCETGSIKGESLAKCLSNHRGHVCSLGLGCQVPTSEWPYFLTSLCSGSPMHRSEGNDAPTSAAA